MEMFAHDDELVRWERALLSLRGPARLPALLPLSWHLRQRDSARAAALVQESLQLLAASTLPDAHQRQLVARLQLVQAETVWLAGNLESASELLNPAYTSFSQLGDHQGCADTHWLRAWIAIDHGDHQLASEELELMAAAARSVDDQQRVDIAEAATARWAVMHDLTSAERRWGARFSTSHEYPTAVMAGVYDFIGLAASQHRNNGAAVR